MAGELRPAYALTIVNDLAALGYDARWGIISAADAGAPHQRDRWWCVAYASRERLAGSPTGERASHQYRKHPARKRGRPTVFYAFESGGKSADVENTDGAKRKARGTVHMGARKSPKRSTRSGGRGAEPGLGGAAHGTAGGVEYPRWPAYQGQKQYAWEAARVSDKAASPYRRQRIKALGNGGIWTIAYELAAGIQAALIQRREEKMA